MWSRVNPFKSQAPAVPGNNAPAAAPAGGVAGWLSSFSFGRTQSQVDEVRQQRGLESPKVAGRKSDVKASAPELLPLEEAQAAPKKALILGMGPIGLGVFGLKLSQNGYHITGVTHSSRMAVNETGKVNVYIETAHGPEQHTVSNVHVLSARDTEHVTQAFIDADIANLSIPEAQVASVATDIARYMMARHQTTRPPLVILIALNKVDGATFVRNAVQKALAEIAPADQIESIMQSAHFVGTVVNNIARNPNAAEAERDPTAVYTEHFVGDLPVQKDMLLPEQLVGIAQVDNLTPYEEMKLFLSNGAHATVAYLGHARGHTYIHEAASDPEIFALVERMLDEAIPGVLAKWPEHLNPRDVNAYCRSALERFKDSSVADHITRVARNPIRKIGENDRLVATALMAIRRNHEPRALAHAIACAIHYSGESAGDHDPKRIAEVLTEASDLDSGVHEVLVRFAGLEKHGEHGLTLIRLVQVELRTLRSGR